MRISLLPYAHQMCLLPQRWGAAVLIAVAATVSAAADVPVYRCNTGNGAMLYTDQPCADGQRLDVQPSIAADPAALERLERMRADLDRSAERRRAEEQRAVAQRALAQDLARQAAEQRADIESATIAPYDTYGYVASWYPPTRHRLSHRFRPPPLHEHQRFAPRPPYAVPRR